MKKILLNTKYPNRKNYKKYYALVDNEDYEKVSKRKWSTAFIGNVIYVQNHNYGKPIFMHKFITGYKLTDHINHNGLDNRRKNLREATHRQNQMNKRSSSNTSSRYKGVSWDKVNRLWFSAIKDNGKTYSLGRHKTQKLAAIAYNEKAKEFFGEFANLNKIR